VLSNLTAPYKFNQTKEHTMSLTKTTAVDQITVTENGIVLYREATRIMEDGNQISQTYHRSSLTPGQDLTGVPANVAAICNVAWTAEVIAAYQAAQAETAGA
jgi:hypothetical protein